MAAAMIASALLAAAPAAAQIAKDQQRCINTMEKDFGRIDKQVGRQVASCLKNNAKGRPLSPFPSVDTVFECLFDDPRNRIFSQEQRTLADFSLRCTPPLPSFGPTDTFDLIDASEEAARIIARSIWTDDLDGELVLESADKPAAVCQQKVWKAATKCEKAKLKEFARCAKKGLRGAASPGLIDSAADLQNLCMGVGTNGQPDPRNKMARSCAAPGKGIERAIARSCDDTPLPLTSLFPTCGTVSPAATADCLDRKVSCAVCMALNAANGLDRDCELFDDGLVNNSCACGNGVVNAGEDCDDGNNQSHDGCSFDCRVEIG